MKQIESNHFRRKSNQLIRISIVNWLWLVDSCFMTVRLRLLIELNVFNHFNQNFSSRWKRRCHQLIFTRDRRNIKIIRRHENTLQYIDWSRKLWNIGSKRNVLDWQFSRIAQSLTLQPPGPRGFKDVQETTSKNISTLVLGSSIFKPSASTLCYW